MATQSQVKERHESKTTDTSDNVSKPNESPTKQDHDLRYLRSNAQQRGE
jgi:hypothetical protein